MAGENVIVVSFAEDNSAYEALTNLKELNEQGQLSIKGAAIVQRGEDGRIVTEDSASEHRSATATGGLIGLLVGILGGPFGVLIGGATGLLIGSLYDVEDAAQTQSVLAEISRAIHPGHTVVLAEVDEQSDDVVDEAMARLNGTVMRRSVADVEAEMAVAEHAERAAKREARKHLVETRHVRTKEEVERIVEALKAHARTLAERLQATLHKL